MIAPSMMTIGLGCALGPGGSEGIDEVVDAGPRGFGCDGEAHRLGMLCRRRTTRNEKSGPQRLKGSRSVAGIVRDDRIEDGRAGEEDQIDIPRRQASARFGGAFCIGLRLVGCDSADRDAALLRQLLEFGSRRAKWPSHRTPPSLEGHGSSAPSDQAVVWLGVKATDRPCDRHTASVPGPTAAIGIQAGRPGGLPNALKASVNGATASVLVN